MTKPQITIAIGGPSGSGKSTLAEYIAADLSIRHGVKVVLRDDGGRVPNPTSAQHLPNYFDADVTINVEQK